MEGDIILLMNGVAATKSNALFKMYLEGNKLDDDDEGFIVFCAKNLSTAMTGPYFTYFCHLSDCKDDRFEDYTTMQNWVKECPPKYIPLVLAFQATKRCGPDTRNTIFQRLYLFSETENQFSEPLVSLQKKIVFDDSHTPFEDRLRAFSDVCFFCEKESANTMLCGGCKIARYCNVECQKQDWQKTHKNVCNMYKHERKNMKGKARGTQKF